MAFHRLYLELFALSVTIFSAITLNFVEPPS